MSRRLKSFFYRGKPQDEGSPTRSNGPLAFVGGLLRKFCLLIGGVVVFSVVMSIIAGIILGGGKNLPDDMVLVLNITKPISETATTRSLTDPLGSAEMSVEDIVTTLDRAGTDDRVRGILVGLDHAGMELAHIQELRAAIKRFRSAGKFAYIYTASFAELGSGVGAYYLASAFDKIWMQPVGFVTLSGLAFEMPFLKKLLDKVGAKPEFLHREEYKSAMESFTHEHMTAPNREMMTSILNDFSGQIFKDIAEDRKLKNSDLQAIFDTGFLPGDKALKAGLIDRLDYADVLIDETLEKSIGKDATEEDSMVFAEDYFNSTLKEHDPRANVALVRISGQIVPGSEYEPGVATGDYIASAIKEAAEMKRIKVIVIRVDSPGGSPSASETIRRSVIYAKNKGKRVLVSMGPTAASGGYWLTVNADRIFALPTTLTGSIGVIMGKVEITALWDKLGVNWDTITWGENARLWSMNAPLDEKGRAALNAAIDDTYKSFIDRVAEGRGIETAKVREIAKGRAWTGLQAKKNGLVDQIGGLDTTLDYAAKVIGAKDRAELRIITLPEPPSAFVEIMRMLKQGAFVSMLGHESSAVLGPAAPMVENMRAMQRGGPVQAYDPDLVFVRP
jgi:protease-4